MYLSFYPSPSYDMAMLEQLGIDGEYNLFNGKVTEDRGTTFIEWGKGTVAVRGKNYKGKVKTRHR